MTNMQVLNFQKGYDGGLKPQMEVSVTHTSLKGEQPLDLMYNYPRREDTG